MISVRIKITLFNKPKSEVTMKHFLFILILFLLIFITDKAFAQPQESTGHLHIIELNADEPCFVKTLRIDVSVGDTVQFRTTNGDFGVYLINASCFLSTKEQDLKFIVDSANPNSEKYLVIKPTCEAINYCSIFCISTLNWPDAPPRIIVSAR